jgi:hypothetical protein
MSLWMARPVPTTGGCHRPITDRTGTASISTPSPKPLPAQREFGSLAELVPHLAGHVLAPGFLEGWYGTGRIAVAGFRRVRFGQSI